jgi:ribosome maturation factor RimP
MLFPKHIPLFSKILLSSIFRHIFAVNITIFNTRGHLVPSFIEKKMELRAQLVQLVDENLPSQEHFLVDIILKGTDQQRKVVVLLDGDNGVSISDCARVSRAMAASLEEDDPFPGQYTLEVSSAGLDHPLSLRRQYLSRTGKALALRLTGGEELEGKLLEVAEDEILIDKVIKIKKRKTTEATKVPFAQIEKAMVQVSFK